MYSSIYRVQSSTRRLPIRALFGFTLKLVESYLSLPLRASVWWFVLGTNLGSPHFGTFLSQVMQQGDCNAPATFQWLMTVVLREYIGQFVHVYLDDIFVFSNMLEEHERHLRLVLDALTKAEFYLERDKCDLYAVRLDCLGHMIDKHGVHADVMDRFSFFLSNLRLDYILSCRT